MKKRILAVLLAVLLLLLSGCGVTESRRKVVINYNAVATQTFSFGSLNEGEGVQATGTVIVQKEKKDATATVIAHIKVAETRPEGVSFYCKKGWNFSTVLTDFPVGATMEEKYHSSTIVYAASFDSEYSYIAEVGCDRNTLEPGFEGDVVMEITWNYDSFGPTVFEMLASIGGGYTSALNPDGKQSVLISIPLE